jgi:DNA-directed RNA polymerase specialized sigma subunit
VIRSEAEYREALKRLEADRLFIQAQREALEGEGFNPDEVATGLEPTLAFHAQLKEEVSWYERVKRLDFDTITSLTQLGRLLIAVRIGLEISQKELADRLDVSEAQVSRDERNEYHGIGVERAQRIFDALGVRMTTKVDVPSKPFSGRHHQDHGSLVPA